MFSSSKPLSQSDHCPTGLVVVVVVVVVVSLRKKIEKITACPFLTLLFGKFWGHQVLGASSFGGVEFQGRQVLGRRVLWASSFGGVEFWRHWVLGALSRVSG